MTGQPPQLPAEREAIGIGQAEVEQHQIEAILLQPTDRLGARAGELQAITPLPQQAPHGLLQDGSSSTSGSFMAVPSQDQCGACSGLCWPPMAEAPCWDER